MTESEAIIKHIEENNNRIENIKFFMSSNPDANIDDCKRNIEILTISNKALEKQIPKKPEMEKYTKRELYFCPICGTEVTDCKYCPQCGQKIELGE